MTAYLITSFQLTFKRIAVLCDRLISESTWPASLMSDIKGTDIKFWVKQEDLLASLLLFTFSEALDKGVHQENTRSITTEEQS